MIQVNVRMKPEELEKAKAEAESWDLLCRLPSEHSTACFRCGSIDTISLREKTEPEPAGGFKRADRSGPEEIKSILLDLCKETYECSYQSHEWNVAIDKAIERLKPYLREQLPATVISEDLNEAA